jgi:hypothetical protein
VKTTISDLGHSDYSEWFIGHSHSTYYRKPQSEKLELFRKIEPYLTYLDYSELEAKGADVETKLQEKESRIQGLQDQLAELSKKLYKSGVKPKRKSPRRALEFRARIKELALAGKTPSENCISPFKKFGSRQRT